MAANCRGLVEHPDFRGLDSLGLAKQERGCQRPEGKYSCCHNKRSHRVHSLPVKLAYSEIEFTRLLWQLGGDSSGVVLAVRGEDVQNLGVFICGSLMFDITWNQEAISRGCLEDPAGMLEGEMAADDIHHLFVRMAVPRADPTLLHPVPDEHHTRAIGHDLPPES